MGTELKQRQGSVVAPDRKADRGLRRPIWPYVVGSLAIAMLLVAGLAFFAPGGAVPHQIDPVTIQRSMTETREGGEYAELGSGSLTEVREGGQYAEPEAGFVDPQTEAREGGQYAELGSGSVTEAREGGVYAGSAGHVPPPLFGSGSQTEVREGGEYVEP